MQRLVYFRTNNKFIQRKTGILAYWFNTRIPIKIIDD